MSASVVTRQSIAFDIIKFVFSEITTLSTIGCKNSSAVLIQKLSYTLKGLILQKPVANRLFIIFCSS